MSSPEVERFDITEDDLANEFNHKRRGFRQTQHQATYGIWADEASDEEGQGRAGFGRTNRSKQHKDYHAPLNFVSGGIKVGSGKDEETMENFDITDSEDEADKEDKNKTQMKQQKKRQPKTGVGNGFSGGRVTSAGKAVGDWEKHTKGIGQKLLEKMGHIPGRGLGKTLQGISAPVEAFKRGGKAALGFYGNERSEQSKKDYPVEADSNDEKDEDDENDFREKLDQWKSGSNDKVKKKVTYQYKTAEDLLSSKTNLFNQKSILKPTVDCKSVKVIDMTGKEERILSGYSAIAHRTNMQATDILVDLSDIAFDLPELIHNLDLLVDISENELIHDDKRLNHEGDLAVNLNHEKQRIDDICNQESSRMNRLQEIIELIKELEDNCEDSRIDLVLQNVVAVIDVFRTQYAVEFYQYHLYRVAHSIGIPLICDVFRDWKPLAEPRKNLTLLLEWRCLLSFVGEDSDQIGHDTRAQMHPVSKILWLHWFPHIRSASSVWNTREPSQMADLLDSWLSPSHLVSDWLRSAVMDQLIMPRLTTAVDNWDPLTDTVPIHMWIHPWLHIARDKLIPLYAPIRYKLARALKKWHPSDPSAKLIIQPWVGVFTEEDMNAFLVNNVVPKLTKSLHQMLINPQNQDLEPWYNVLSWDSLLQRHHIVHLLVTNFFPKWLHTLSLWLTDNPDYQEITKWYAGWKSVIPADIGEEKSIKDKFTKALNIMNKSLSGKKIKTDSASFYTNNPAPLPTEPLAPVNPEAITPKQKPSHLLSFREMIEKTADRHGVLFMPIPNRTQLAKQVYKLGPNIVYIDRNVIFVKDDASGENVWIPASLDSIISSIV